MNNTIIYYAFIFLSLLVIYIDKKRGKNVHFSKAGQAGIQVHVIIFQSRGQKIAQGHSPLLYSIENIKLLYKKAADLHSF